MLASSSKIIAALVIAAFVIGPSIPLVAHAQVGFETSATQVGANSTAGTGAGAPTAPGTANGGTSSSNIDLQCSATNGIGLAVCVSGFVYWITVGLGSWFANITAYIFDYAVQLSLASGAYALDFIAIGWGIVRDVANMSFLFILVYIAFKIMFQAETAGTIRMLVWVVVVALLVNFSFVMTRLVVDAGNITALQFYNAIASGAPPISNPTGNSTPVAQTGASQTKDITASIMNALSPQNILGTSFKNFVAQKNNSGMYYLVVSSVVYIMTGIALFMLAAVFIFAGIRFVMRVIGLWFVIIAAPGAFVAAIFSGKGGGAKWFNAWLGYLLEFSFYPAVFLFMYYIEVRFMTEMGTSSMFNDIFQATSNGGASWQLIVQAAASVGVRLGFILSTMYLILKASMWMGQAFNSIGTKWVQNRLLPAIGRGTLRGAIGTTAFVGRNTLGATGYIRGNAALANSTYDVRNVPFVRTLVGNSLGKGTPANRAFGLADRDMPEARKKAAEASMKEKERQAKVDEKHGAERAANEQREREREEEVRAKHATERVERARATGVDDITTVTPDSVPAGRRRLPGGAPITSVAGGPTGVPASTPFNIAAQRALDEIKEKAQQNARAGAVAVNLVSTPPDMTRSKEVRADQTRTAAPIEQQQLGGLREEIKGLGQSVREAVAAAKNGTSLPPKLVVTVPEHSSPTTPVHIAAGSAHFSEEDAGKIAKKLAHKLEPMISSHSPESTPPTPAAPAAARPTPPPPADLGGTLPKAA